MTNRRRLDLIRRVQLAIAIGREALEAAREENPCAAGTQQKWSSARGLQLPKVVAEVAMLLRCAQDTAPELTPVIDEAARALKSFARGHDVLAKLCEQPALALEDAGAHIHLTALGYPDSRVDRLLDEIARDPLFGSERLPYREVEMDWLRQIWQGSTAPPSSELLSRTCLAWPLDALRSSTTDLYIFTHVILHASDMGRHSAPWPRRTAAIAQDAEAGIAAALDADNFDLTTELLWTWPMLGLSWSPTAAFAFELMVSIQDRHGFLPGPEWCAETCAGLAEGARRLYMLRTSYHANLVMGFLAAATMRRAEAPSRRVPKAKCRPGLDEVLGMVQTSAPPRRWQAAMMALPPASQSALMGLALNVVVRRAARQRDLHRVRQCLNVWLQHDFPDGPAVHQCLGLLRRATIVAPLVEGPLAAPSPATHSPQ